MNKKINNSIVRSVVELVRNGLFDEARKLMENHLTEEDFLNSITSSKINTNVFQFVQTFENPDWYSYSQKINSKHMLECFNFFNQNNISIFESKDKEEPLFITMLLQLSNTEREIVLEQVSNDNLSKALMDKNTDIVSLFYKLLYRDYSHDSNYQEKNNVSKIFIKKIEKSAFINSTEHISLLSEKNKFTEFLLDQKKLLNLLEEFPSFFSPNKKILLDTFFAKTLVTNANISDEGLKEIIENKSFSPDFNLLRNDIKDAVIHGRINLTIESEKYEAFKELLKNGLLDIEKFNNPQSPDDTFTVFERLLIQNLEINDSYYECEKEDVVLNKINKVIAEANELIQYGIEKKCILWSSKALNSLIDNKLSPPKNKKYSFEKDVEDLSYLLKIHPRMIDEVIKILDRRYNFNPEAKPVEEVSENQKNMRKAWKELMDGVVFIKDLQVEEEKKAKIKP